MLSVEQLGNRICIIGNSSAGKSTLAQALGRSLSLSICHLDQIAHVPNTNWQPRDRNLLKIEHRQFLENNDSWVIDGNYSYLIPERFNRATFIIWLDFRVSGSIYRYIKRSINASSKRPGNLPGASRQFSFKMIKHIILHASKNRKKYHRLIEESGIPYLHLNTFGQLMECYDTWGLKT